MKITRRQLRQLIREAINDLSWMNGKLLKTGFNTLAGEGKSQHILRIKDFLNNEIDISNDEFNELFSNSDVRAAGEKYRETLSDRDLRRVFSTIRRVLQN